MPRSTAAVALVVLAAGLAVRVGLVLASPGGFGGDFGYDPGVYYTASDTLLSGHLPYRDFTLLHPPLLMLVLTPFAALGRVTSDHAGFVAANAAFTVLGAANGSLVSVVARRLGCPPAASLTGGLFYAVWFGVAATEVTTRLEPLGNTAFLLALLWLTGRRSVPAGIALGLAVCVKVWWIVPVLVVLIAVAARRPAAQARRTVAAAVLAAVVVCAPFFLAAPAAMWHMVVTDQLGRAATTSDRLQRASRMLGLHALDPGSGRRVEALALLVVVVALVLVARPAVRHRWGRLVTALAVTQLAVLALSPSYFDYYAAFAAVGVALLLACGAARSRTAAGFSAAVTVAALVVTLAVAHSEHAVLSKPVPDSLADRVRHVHCLMTDTPSVLIDLDALTRNLDHGCPNWVDVSGRTYGVDAPTGSDQRRPHNARWQRDIRAYLLSGDAFIVARTKTGLSADTRRFLMQHSTLLARAGHWQVRRVRRT